MLLSSNGCIVAGLTQLIADFIEYTEHVNFKERSRDAIKSRLKQLSAYCESQNIQNVNDITFQHLLCFVAEFGYCSVHVKKSKIWAIHQFFHFLTLKNIIPQNIALALSYPKVGKKEPMFLTVDEFNQILKHVALKTDKHAGLRNLIITMLLGILGLRVTSVTLLDVDDVDIANNTIRVIEKATIYKRVMPIPDVLSSCIAVFLEQHPLQHGPLFLSKRKKRISACTIQQWFRDMANELNIDKKIHPHLFRHTAATWLNKTAGTSITQFVLGHARRANTHLYAHLNPDVYATYMQRHPYMNIPCGDSICKN